jgi:hypothetical protein
VATTEGVTISARTPKRIRIGRACLGFSERAVSCTPAAVASRVPPAPGRRVKRPLPKRGPAPIRSSDSGQPLLGTPRSLDAACDAGAANSGVPRDTPSRSRPGRSPRHSPATTAHMAGRSFRQGKMILRRGVRLWEPIQQLLCWVVKRSRSRPNRFQIRFQIPNCRRQGDASEGPRGADLPGGAEFWDDRLLAGIRPYGVTGRAMKSRPTTGTREGAAAALRIDWRGSRAKGRSRLWANAAPVFQKYSRRVRSRGLDGARVIRPRSDTSSPFRKSGLLEQPRGSQKPVGLHNRNSLVVLVEMIEVPTQRYYDPSSLRVCSAAGNQIGKRNIRRAV